MNWIPDSLLIRLYRYRYQAGPLGVWGTTFGSGGMDMAYGNSFKFLKNGSVEEDYWTLEGSEEFTHQWRLVGNRTIEVSEGSNFRVLKYDFMVRLFEGKKQVCLYEPGNKGLEDNKEPGFWTCVHPLVLYSK